MDEIKNLAGAADATASAPEAAPAPAEAEEKLENAVAAEAPETSAPEPEVKEAMDKAIQNPTEDTIFQLSSITEATAFKAGVRECLKMFRELLVDNPEK